MVMEPRLDSSKVGAFFRARVEEDEYRVGSAGCTSALRLPSSNSKSSDPVSFTDLSKLRRMIDVVRWERQINGVHETFPWIVLRLTGKSLVSIYTSAKNDEYANNQFFRLSEWASSEVGARCSQFVFEGIRGWAANPKVVFVVEGLIMLSGGMHRHLPPRRHHSPRVPLP